MSKRPASKQGTSTRKRKRNGLSYSRMLLDSVEIPPEPKPSMCVWEADPEDHHHLRVSAVHLQPQANNTYQEGLVLDQMEDVARSTLGPTKEKKKKKGKINNSVSLSAVPPPPNYNASKQTKMLSWLNYRSQILDELLRHDGLQDYPSPPPCSNCLDDPGLYRCLDCSAIPLYCDVCIVSRHDWLPLHRIEVRLHYPPPSLSHVTLLQVWSDGFYQRTTLLELGHSFYIGHHHTPCPSPDSSFRKIIVIDLSGAHRINVQFCACVRGPGCVEPYRQLLRMRWYPASLDRPRTAFTFDLLDAYHKITLQGKLNLYDFYTAVLQRSDNCGRKRLLVSRSVIPSFPVYSRRSSIGIMKFHDASTNGET